MAVRNYELDEKIIQAAKAEFLECGYQKASLHRIAKNAGITTGALYTRYSGKDDLFCRLIQPMTERVKSQLASIAQVYEKVRISRKVEDFLQAIQTEEKIYLDLLFEYYQECTLFFCKSHGSSIGDSLDGMMDRKVAQTKEFLKELTDCELNTDGIEFVLFEQFDCYRRILEKGYTKEQALSGMKTVDIFIEAGWKSFFEQCLVKQ